MVALAWETFGYMTVAELYESVLCFKYCDVLVMMKGYQVLKRPEKVSY